MSSDFTVRPIILGYGHTPDAAYNDAVDNAIYGPNGVAKFYHAYGQSLDWREPYRTASFSTDYRTLANPWYPIYHHLYVETGFLLPEELAIVIATDWQEQDEAAGWGGVPMGLVGKFSADRLVSPDLLDDWLPEGIIAHEVGHALGFAHDYTRPNNVMGAGVWRWPECGPSQHMIDLASAKLAASTLIREASGVEAFMLAEPCRR